jgi:pyruvate kinase
MIERLFLAGVDVFRINMSHSSHEAARALQNSVRWVAKRHRHPIGLLADLQGPKFRIGEFPGGRVFVNDGAVFRFEASERPGTSEGVFLPHPQIFAAVEPGHMLLLDDGRIRMRVIEKKADSIAAEVLVGGALGSRKGISVPDTLLPVGPLTEKDRADLAYLLKLGIDWLALSFLQRGEDVHDVRKLVGDRAAILAKIEKPSAIVDLDAIIAASDGLMVARGDLGVEIPVERVPGLQKKITRKARAAGKPVVVATQMLESMISSPLPTRAEVSDVATAVFDGADAIAAAAHAIADTVKLSAIVCYTATGSTALRVTRERPNLPIIGLTPVETIARRLSLVWGIQSVMTGDPANLTDMVNKACRIAFDEGFVKPNDGLLITAGVPLGSPGATNMIRIAFVDANGEPMAEGR